MVAKDDKDAIIMKKGGPELIVTSTKQALLKVQPDLESNLVAMKSILNYKQSIDSRLKSKGSYSNNPPSRLGNNSDLMSKPNS